eukprot:m.14875 g.14875  ORF g.14875 m.14875 type:complete len:365 (-) comp10365_c0_seq1:77-1171(-)
MAGIQRAYHGYLDCHPVEATPLQPAEAHDNKELSGTLVPLRTACFPGQEVAFLFRPGTVMHEQLCTILSGPRPYPPLLSFKLGTFYGLRLSIKAVSENYAENDMQLVTQAGSRLHITTFSMDGTGTATVVVDPVVPRNIWHKDGLTTTQYPRAIWRQMDLSSLAAKAQQLLKLRQPNYEIQRCHTSEQYEALSYDLLARLPDIVATAQNKAWEGLIRPSHPCYRLQQIVTHLRRTRLRTHNLACKHCDLVLTSSDQVFELRSSHLVGNYVNPEGYQHEILTTYTATVVLVGEPSLLHTWFNGYAWTIAVCPRCGEHVGWRYDYQSDHPNEDNDDNDDSPDSGEGKAKPLQQFFGICRGVIAISE